MSSASDAKEEYNGHSPPPCIFENNAKWLPGPCHSLESLNQLIIYIHSPCLFRDRKQHPFQTSPLEPFGEGLSISWVSPSIFGKSVKFCQLRSMDTQLALETLVWKQIISGSLFFNFLHYYAWLPFTHVLNNETGQAMCCEGMPKKRYLSLAKKNKWQFLDHSALNRKLWVSSSHQIHPAGWMAYRVMGCCTPKPGQGRGVA